MGVLYRYLSVEGADNAVVDWFRNRPEQPIEILHTDGSVFHFAKLGPLVESYNNSPVVNVFRSKRLRSAFTTIGEVHFLLTPVSSIPKYASLKNQFCLWLGQFPLVFSRRPSVQNQWEHYLEGSVRNYDSDIFALSEGITALNGGEYFVSHGDSEFMLDKVYRSLQLRGVV